MNKANDAETPGDQGSASSHCYADRVSNFKPIHPLDMAEQAGLPIEYVMDFFDENFGGYAAYVRQCEDKESIGKTLAIMAGDESA